MTSETVIIIGSGLAGYTLAREFRKLDKQTAIIMFSTDDACSYSKPMLSNAFAKNKSAEDLAMFDAEHMAKQLDITICAFTTVTSIQTENNTLTATSLQGNEQQYSYSKLVFALGAEQIKLPFKGNATEDVLTVNDLADYAEFREKVAGKKSVAIIGGGLIGCEFANDLIHADHTVHVIELNELPLQSLLPEAAAMSIHSALSDLGIHWHLAQAVTQIDKQGDCFNLSLSNNGDAADTEIVNDIDLVLSAIGLKPRVTLAETAGVKTDRGIIVDRELRTSVNNIFALGDCAEVDGLVLPYVMPLMNAARALAKTLNNDTTPVNYPAMPVAIKTPACPIIVLSPPTGLEGQWTTTTTEDGTKSLFMDTNYKLRGFALTGSATSERTALAKEVPGLF